MLEVCRFIKDKYNKTIRINTNVLPTLFTKRTLRLCLTDLSILFSISLNTPNKERYLELTRSKFGIESFDAMIKFAENVKHYVKEVVLSTVSTTLTEEEEKECRPIFVKNRRDIQNKTVRGLIIMNTVATEMIKYYAGDKKRNKPFIKVHGYAKAIGEAEELDERTMLIT